jgi:hypothetical protein
MENDLPSGVTRLPRMPPALWRWPVVALLTLLAYLSLRLAWADHLSCGPDLAARERAIALAPFVATFAERLAQFQEASGADSLPALQLARSLDPENPDRLMRLGQRAELAGDYSLAERSLISAAERSRLYQPKYLLAQFYFRRRRELPFWRWTRAAMEVAPCNLAPVFELCWRMRPDGEWLSHNIIPSRREVWHEYLTYLTDREHPDDAARMARTLADTACAGDVDALIRYCDSSLSKGLARQPWDVWNILCRRGLLPGPPADPSHNRLLTNGDFQHAPSGIGFDWRLAEEPGVAITAGNGRMIVNFSGHQSEQCPLAWQFVSLQMGGRYRLRFEVKDAGEGAGDDIAGNDIAADIVGAISQPGAGIFSATRELGRVLLLYRRPAGSVRREGGIAIEHVQLERVL